MPKNCGGYNYHQGTKTLIIVFWCNSALVVTSRLDS
jgi:hypothetical protein